ncbi:MAG: MmgE/PrpD family protein [Peptococcaceae bacterium]|jgi:2-methylcitrate dehydratase PrpD|nr:MmgE/PrpD family protein [Peptococcaceae bacterium]
MVTTERIAKLIDEFRYDSIPPRGVEQAKAAVIDAAGVSLLGSREKTGKALLKHIGAGESEEARVWGTGARVSLRNAVLANSACVHMMDYDNGGSLGHPGCILIPAALGLAEKYKLTGKQIIEAYAVAYELGFKLRESLGDIQMGAGWHATSLLGPICVAALSSKLMGLDVRRTRMALAIAAPMGGGLLQSFGTDAKILQVARAAENGLLAALLAVEGCEGDPCIFEESKGFYYVYGQAQSSIKLLTANFGKPPALAAERGHFKQWACCGGNYEALSILYDMLGEGEIPPEDITRIVAATSMEPPGPVIRPHPRTPMEGRFSLPYNIASCLIDRAVDLSAFTDEKYNRPAVHELMGRIEVIWHPECAGKPARLQGESRFVEITIYMRDGRVLRKRQDAADRKQLTAGQVYDKFADIARSIGKDETNIRQTVDLVRTFESCADAKQLVDLICSGD